MHATELARLVDSWSDALTIAEIMNNPRYQVSEKWDFHDWQAVDCAEGITFQHVAASGQVVESVRIAIQEESEPGTVPAQR
jgi:hypothetical protein